MAPRQELIVPSPNNSDGIALAVSSSSAPPSEESSSTFPSVSTAALTKGGGVDSATTTATSAAGGSAPSDANNTTPTTSAMTFRPFYPASSSAAAAPSMMSPSRLPPAPSDPPIMTRDHVPESSQVLDFMSSTQQDRALSDWATTSVPYGSSAYGGDPSLRITEGNPTATIAASTADTTLRERRKNKKKKGKASSTADECSELVAAAAATAGSGEINAPAGSHMGITTNSAPSATYDPNSSLLGGGTGYNSYGGSYGGLGSGLLGGMMGGGYGGGMYPPSPYMMSPYGYGMGMASGGPLSSLNQFLFGVQSVVFSLGQAVTILSANASAIQQLLDAAMAMFDHAVATYHEMKVLDQKKIKSSYSEDDDDNSEYEDEESEEDKKRRRRLKALRYAVMTAVSYAGYRLVRRAITAASRRRIDSPSPHSPYPQQYASPTATSYPPHQQHQYPPYNSTSPYPPQHPTAPYYSPY